MNIAGKQKIVVLGMMSKLRVAGGIWQNIHYLIGLQRLGFDVYYVETHGCVTWAFKENELEAAAFIDSVMRRFDLGDRWSFHARSGSGRHYGMSEQQVRALCSEAAAILNLHGGTVPAPEHLVSNRLVLIDTDPTAVQIEIHDFARFEHAIVRAVGIGVQLEIREQGIARVKNTVCGDMEDAITGRVLFPSELRCGCAC